MELPKSWYTIYTSGVDTTVSIAVAQDIQLQLKQQGPSFTHVADSGWSPNLIFTNLLGMHCNIPKNLYQGMIEMSLASVKLFGEIQQQCDNAELEGNKLHKAYE